MFFEVSRVDGQKVDVRYPYDSHSIITTMGARTVTGYMSELSLVNNNLEVIHTRGARFTGKTNQSSFPLLTDKGQLALNIKQVCSS